MSILRRYSVAIDDKATDAYLMNGESQSSSNKQGSGEYLDSNIG